MLMKMLIFLFVLLIPAGVLAQRYKTVELKPITKQGWRYYYDLKKVKSHLALEIPLMSLNDEEITKYVQASKAYQSAAIAVAFIPVVYIFTIPGNSGYVNPTTFWIIMGGSLATQIGLNAIGHNKLGKAIDRYNTLIFKPSSRSLGVEMVWRF